MPYGYMPNNYNAYTMPQSIGQQSTTATEPEGAGFEPDETAGHCNS